jgi:Ca2+-transporting ATPase
VFKDKNAMMLIAFVLGIVLQLLVIEVGAVSKMFSTCNLSLYDWGISLLFGLTPLVIHEIVVLINKIRIKK